MYEISGVALRLGEYMVRHDRLIWDYARAANEGRRFLEDRFRELGIKTFVSHANFLLAEMPPPVDPRRVAERLRDRGFLIKGDFSDPVLQRCVRVTTASVGVLAKFWAAFEDAYSEARRLP